MCDEDRSSCACTSAQGFNVIKRAPDAPIDNLIILATQVSALAAQDLLWWCDMHKYPDLKVAWSEAGIGWIPFYLDRCDRHYTNQRWLGHDFGDKLPSDIFREHSLACYVTDPSRLEGAPRHRHRHHRLGVRLPALRLDLARRARSGAGGARTPVPPTRTSTRSRGRTRAGTSATTRSSTSPQEDATVGALRAQAPDVDISTKSRAEWRKLYEAREAAAHAVG